MSNVRRFCVILIVLLALPLRADEPKMSFIRDAEIENYLRDLAAPVFRAAELNARDVNILLVNNDSLNAFVAGGQNIFIYTGLLREAETPEQLQGVIAHETGHIANGDLIRGTKAMEKASAQAMIGMVAVLAAALATGKADIAAGAGLGMQSMAERSFLSFSRAQESAADAAALRFLDAAGISAEGFLAFMKKMAGQELMPEDRRSEYVRTHPLSQDRIEAVAHHVATTERPANQGSKNALYVARHARMQAKLFGFLRPEATLMRYTAKDASVEARYARAIALYRKSRLKEALPLLDSLLKNEPDNPFFHELKGQMLFENGRVAQAALSYQKAVDLLPSSALLRVLLAHALLENGNDKDVDAVIAHLLEADRMETRDPQTWRFLAVAWNKKGAMFKEDSYKGLVFYALAEESMALGKNALALDYAARAVDILPKGSSYWLRAQDLRISAEKEK